VKLNAALAAIARDSPAAANQLRAFTYELAALAGSGRLDRTAADALIAQVQAIITLIG